VAAVVAGLALAVLFVQRQRRLAYPLLDMTLFRQPSFSAAIAAYSLSCLAMFGVYIFITQYLQLVLALSPLEAGLATLPWALAFVVGSLLAPRLAQRWSRVSILTWGLGSAAAGLALLAAVDETGGLPVLIAGTVIMSLGMAPVFTIGNEMIITAASPERAGAASALSETSSEFSGALGIAVFGSIGTAIYRHALSGGLPAGTPADTESAALETLGGAVSAAQTIAGANGAALLAASRAAFVDALQVVVVIGAAVMVTAGIVSARMLR
jgi:DHA2 family multidrug resistance protein-like MFS transporter